ncbi:MAG: glucosamine-6-phosphate deaminase [Lachnospiraceae bacterium]|nr:glucosamine-6-phosphate deaminase [Lachnospiraceae bacterium]
MRIIRAEDYEDISRIAAERIANFIAKKPDAVLGLATGSSPLGTYRRLSLLYSEGRVSFKEVRTVNLDEYVGLSAENEQSYAFFMKENLFDRVDLAPENTHIPDGLEENEEQECEEYDRLIKELGGIDLQLLGLGPNGHIAFNEPGDSFPLGTHKVRLSPATIRANSRFFEREEDIPRFAYTMGIRDILQAKQVIMLVSGAAKAEIVKEAFTGPVTPKVPASILQFHSDFTLIADTEALSLLS